MKLVSTFVSRRPSMKKLFVLTLTALALASTAVPQSQQLPKALKDGGGTEPPCIPCRSVTTPTL
jgi:hypothetical protein